MGSIAEGERDKMIDAWAGRTTYTANAGVYVQLHLGDPGIAGTANPAAETTRGTATFGSAASGGSITNTAAIEWTDVAATEDVTHISCWTDPSAGTFIGSDDLSSTASLTAGDTLRIPIGDLDIAVT